MKENIKDVIGRIGVFIREHALAFWFFAIIPFALVVFKLYIDLFYDAGAAIFLKSTFVIFFFVVFITMVVLLFIFAPQNEFNKKQRNLIGIVSLAVLVAMMIMFLVVFLPGEVTLDHKNCWELQGSIKYKMVDHDSDTYLIVEEFMVFDEVSINRMNTPFHQLFVKDGYFRRNIEYRTIERYEVGALH